MTRRNWARLDNASNIFLAARSDVDPKVFRMIAELDEEVDPAVLQEALDTTYDRYPLYHSVLRRGAFWYFLQDSDLRPQVAADVLRTCAPIYREDQRSLMFRVICHRRRIILEVFHVLSDGTGALWFLSDLVTAYVRLRHPGLTPPAADGQTDAWRILDAPEPSTELSVDSFTRYFRQPGRRGGRAIGPSAGANEHSRPSRAGASDLLPRQSLTGVHRVKGTRAADNRARLIELTAPAKDVLALARAEDISLTMYLTAVFFESVRLAAPGGLGRSRTIAASVPVNLRQFFPSTSPRNFFATARVEHRYGDGDDGLGSIGRELERQLRSQVTPEALELKLRRFMRMERAPMARVMPRPLKDLVLGLANWMNNRGLTVAVSNMGRVSLPEPVDAFVRRIYLQVSAVRPQFCSVSHDGKLTISFTSPFVETDHVREFARILTGQGIDVSVAVARATETELGEETR